MLAYFEITPRNIILIDYSNLKLRVVLILCFNLKQTFNILKSLKFRNVLLLSSILIC